MPSTFYGLTIAGSGLNSFQTAVNTTANNIANVQDVYKRQIQYHAQEIIPYQEIIGNYSSLACPRHAQMIIPYQEIIGNYSCQGWYGILESLSIPQNKKIPLLRII